MQTILEARRAAPAILLLPHLHLWWATAPSSLKTTLQVCCRPNVRTQS